MREKAKEADNENDLHVLYDSILEPDRDMELRDLHAAHDMRVAYDESVTGLPLNATEEDYPQLPGQESDPNHITCPLCKWSYTGANPLHQWVLHMHDKEKTALAQLGPDDTLTDHHALYIHHHGLNQYEDDIEDYNIVQGYAHEMGITDTHEESTSPESSVRP